MVNKMNYNVIAESENIDFIKINQNLIDDYLIMVNDENIQKYIYKNKKIFSYEDELNWVNEKLNQNATIFSMIEKSTGNFIGNFEFMDIKEDSSEIGICITSNYQNKHFGKEAMLAMMEYSFNVMKLDEINLVVFSTNKRAINLYKKLEFEEYKREKNIIGIDGPLDYIYMRLSKQ